MDTKTNTKAVHLWDLPKSMVYVDLAPSFKHFLLTSCKNIAKTWINLGKEFKLKINKRNKCKALEGIIEGKKIKLELLFLLVSYLSKNGIKISLEDLEKNVTLIASKRNNGNKFANCIISPNLPFNFNTVSGSTLISALLHDGGINSNFNPHYSNTDIGLRRKVYQAFVDVFGRVVGNKSNPSNNQQIYFPKISGINENRLFKNSGYEILEKDYREC